MAALRAGVLKTSAGAFTQGVAFPFGQQGQDGHDEFAGRGRSVEVMNCGYRRTFRNAPRKPQPHKGAVWSILFAVSAAVYVPRPAVRSKEVSDVEPRSDHSDAATAFSIGVEPLTTTNVS